MKSKVEQSNNNKNRNERSGLVDSDRVRPLVLCERDEDLLQRRLAHRVVGDHVGGEQQFRALHRQEQMGPEEKVFA